MARIEVITTTYSFNRPQLLSEADYKSYKQIFQIEPSYSMSPKGAFWKEFSYVKWTLVAFFGGLVLSMIWDPMAIIAAIAFFILIVNLITGTAQSMRNYQSFLDVKNKYYEGLKQAIINSNDYGEFRRRASTL